MHFGAMYSYTAQIVTPMKELPWDAHSVLPSTWMLLLVLTGTDTVPVPIHGAISAAVVKVKGPLPLVHSGLA